MKTSNLILVIIFSLSLSFSPRIIAQSGGGNDYKSSQEWDLEKCINYAHQHNIQVKQMDLQVKSNKSNLEQSKAGLLPGLNANGSYSSNRGRSIDPTTNDFTESEFSSMNMSIGSSVTLFNGLRQYNSIKQNKYNVQASLAELDEMKYNISMQVAAAYLQILLDTELRDVSANQYEITKAQVNRTKTMVEAGSLPKASLLEIQAQLASEELNKISAENNLKTSYLNLKQLLELDTTDVFSVKKPEFDDISAHLVIQGTDEVFEKSQDLPMIRKQEFLLLSREKSLQIAKGGLSPIVSLSASYGSYYSSRSFNPFGEEYSFNEQLSNNLNFVISLNVRIPIFNGFTVKNNIAQSKIAVENNKYQLEITKNNLYKDIQKARNAADASLAKYNASKKTVEAQSEAFEHTKQRFNLGLVNTVEYNTAKNNYIRAESDMIQSKYDFIFRMNILRFYQGIPFKL